MMTWEYMLGIVLSLMGVFTFMFKVIDRGKQESAQLTRIEHTLQNSSLILDNLFKKVEQIENEQHQSISFRQRYEKPINDLIRHKNQQEKLNQNLQHKLEIIDINIKEIKNRLDKQVKNDVK